MPQVTTNKVLAILGPTNTGKTFLAIERMLEYENGVIYVSDASRAVGVVQKLSNPKLKQEYLKSIDAEYKTILEKRKNRLSSIKFLSLKEARLNKFQVDCIFCCCVWPL